MSREDPQVRVRIPAELKDNIESVAQANDRSMNYVIVEALARAFPHKKEVVIECQLIEGNDNEIMNEVTLLINSFKPEYSVRVINIETCLKPKGVYVYYEYYKR